MLSHWQRTFLCLTRAERLSGISVLLLMIMMAMFEVIGIASILPFLAVVADQGMIKNQPLLAWAYEAGSFKDTKSFLLALGITSITLLLVAAVVRTATLSVQNTFVQMRRHTLSRRLLNGYLRQQYEFFLNRDTSEIEKNILSEVDIFVDSSLIPIGNVISFSLVLSAIMALIIIVDPTTSLLVSMTLTITYILIYRVIRRHIDVSGKQRSIGNRLRFQVAKEALGGIKMLKAIGCEAFYLERFTIGSEMVARNLARSSFLTHIPKYMVETLAFGGIIAAAVINVWQQEVNGSLGTFLPMLSLYAFAGYRMLPAVQNIYSNLTLIRFSAPSVDMISRELKLLEAVHETDFPVTNLQFTHSLELRNVTYEYPNSSVGLKGLSLFLKRGESLGIMGRTGAGKTTLVDVILGLLVPQSGSVVVDGFPLDAIKLNAWRKFIGYVPQDVFLLDSSVAENIAFGIHADQIDYMKVERAAKIANIHEFVAKDLPNGYSTRVGERGVRLSGGQRQRIGIARALYHDPEVIVFDEATSSLDSLTESEVMTAMRSLLGTKTVILIAHRTGTLAACERVVQLEDGRLVDVGIDLDEPERPK